MPQAYERTTNPATRPSRVAQTAGMLYAASIPFDAVPLASGRSLTFPLSLLVAGAVGMDLLHGRRAGRLPPPALLVLGLYATWLTATTFWSYAPDVSVTALYQMVFRFVAMVAVCFLVPSSWEKLAVAYLVGAVILSLVLIIFGEEEYSGRVTLFGADENALGMALAVGFAIVLVVASTVRRRHSVWLIPVGVVLAAGTLSTGSRTGLVALGAAIIARLISVRQWRRPVQTVVLVSLSLAGLLYATSQGLLADRLLEFISGTEFQDETRVEITRAYLGHPGWMLAGTGLQADDAYLNETFGMAVHVHNLILSVWVQLGIVGLVLFLALLTMSARGAWGSARRDLWLTAAAPAAAFAFNLGGQSPHLYWFLLGMGLAEPRALTAIRTKGASNAGA